MPATAVEKPTQSSRGDRSDAANAALKQKRRRSLWRVLGVLAVVIAVLLVIGRLFMPLAVRAYVNRTIDRNPLYDGKIGDVDIHLWRGAYSIHDIRLIKTTGSVPVPLFAAKRIDLELEWSALADHKLVGRVVMQQPELNFVDAASEGESQTGGSGAGKGGASWLQILDDLYPFKLNSARIHDGSVHFRTFQTPKPVDVYLSRLEATVDNLSNIKDEVTPLITTVRATAMAMDQARFEYQMKLDPFAYRPTFHLAVRLLNLDVTKINDLARAYGGMDFERGWFDLVIETDAKEGLIEGYVKPLFRHVQVLGPKDMTEQNPLQFFWEALIGVAAEVFKNHPRDQVATLIPFRGDVSGPTTDFLATVGNVLRNAFIRAYLPRLQTNFAKGNLAPQDLHFGAPSLTDPDSAGD